LIRKKAKGMKRILCIFSTGLQVEQNATFSGSVAIFFCSTCGRRKSEKGKKSQTLSTNTKEKCQVDTKFGNRLAAAEEKRKERKKKKTKEGKSTKKGSVKEK